MAGDTKEIDGAELIGDDSDPLAMVTAATKAAATSVAGALRLDGAAIIRLDAAAAPIPQSQYPKLRVRYLILNANAIDISLQIGTVLYPFTFVSGTGIETVPFPLVIERGTNMAAVGANGRIYVIGDPE